jgi:hypothetical protein
MKTDRGLQEVWKQAEACRRCGSSQLHTPVRLSLGELQQGIKRQDSRALLWKSYPLKVHHKAVATLIYCKACFRIVAPQIRLIAITIYVWLQACGLLSFTTTSSEKFFLIRSIEIYYPDRLSTKQPLI